MSEYNSRRAYRTTQLLKWTRYDLIIEISDYSTDGIRNIHSKRKSELISILIGLESRSWTF